MSRLCVVVAGFVGVAAAGSMVGCGSDDGRKTAASTPAASAAVKPFECPLTAAQIGTALAAPDEALIGKSGQTCEYGIAAGGSGSTKKADSGHPVVFITLLPVPIAALQATAVRDHPGAKVKARPDLGRQTFQIIESITGGGRRATIVADAGAASGSYLTAVEEPAAVSNPGALALKHAEAIFNIKS